MAYFLTVIEHLGEEYVKYRDIINAFDKIEDERKSLCERLDNLESENQHLKEILDIYEIPFDKEVKECDDVSDADIIVDLLRKIYKFENGMHD